MIQIHGQVWGGDAINRELNVKLFDYLYLVDFSEHYTTEEFRNAFMRAFLNDSHIFFTAEPISEELNVGVWKKKIKCKALEYRLMEYADE